MTVHELLERIQRFSNDETNWDSYEVRFMDLTDVSYSVDTLEVDGLTGTVYLRMEEVD